MTEGLCLQQHQPWEWSWVGPAAQGGRRPQDVPFILGATHEAARVGVRTLQNADLLREKECKRGTHTTQACHFYLNTAVKC